MEYEEAVRFIFGFTNYEFTPLASAPASALQLERIRALLARLGDPQRGRGSAHITGSKGKGSTASMIAALLRQAGARTGLYTSPHLHSPRERVMIDGQPIARDEFARLTELLLPQVEAENRLRPDAGLTTFELLTALAFLAFRESGCTWQVMEVGMGGRLDATNVLDEKALCVFTPISLEHTAILGSTTAAIAADKAGILRPGCRAVLAPQDPEPEAVLRRACDALGVPVESVRDACTWKREPDGLDGQHCQIQTPRGCYRFWLPLLGGYQVENAATALLGVENLAASRVCLSADEVAQAFATVRWPGRMEVLSREPLVIADGAHNAASAARLAQSLGDLCAGRRLILVAGTLDDKDLAGMATALAPIAADVIAVRADHPRAMPVERIVQAFQVAGAPARAHVGAVLTPNPSPNNRGGETSRAPTKGQGDGHGVAAGLEEALRAAGPDGAVCVLGSLYVVAEARAALLGLVPE